MGMAQRRMMGGRPRQDFRCLSKDAGGRGGGGGAFGDKRMEFVEGGGLYTDGSEREVPPAALSKHIRLPLSRMP